MENQTTVEFISPTEASGIELSNLTTSIIRAATTVGEILATQTTSTSSPLTTREIMNDTIVPEVVELTTVNATVMNNLTTPGLVFQTKCLR